MATIEIPQLVQCDALAHNRFVGEGPTATRWGSGPNSRMTFKSEPQGHDTRGVSGLAAAIFF